MWSSKHKFTIPPEKYRAWAEIDLDNAAYNFNQVKAATGSRVCCVIKADAYGHGAVQLAKLYQACGADYLAVSNIQEAIQLRRQRITLPILILGYSSSKCAKLLADHHITQCVFSYEYGMELARAAAEARVTVKIHVKIDTGMGRIGFLCRDNDKNELEAAAEVCRQPHLDPEGIFTHFAAADEGEGGEAYTRAQFALFTQAIDRLADAGITFPIRHCANSAAIFDYPESHLDMVRAGIVLYGLTPSAQMRSRPDLRPVMSLRSVISHIKTVEADESVSYGRTYTAPAPRRIATVPIGYADGFSRLVGQSGYCLCVGERAAPIVGRVCMDQLMLDVTDVECRIGDDILVFGDTPPFTAERVAELGHTLNYEVVCDVGKRVPRVFLRGGEITEWKDDILEEIYP